MEQQLNTQLTNSNLANCQINAHLRFLLAKIIKYCVPRTPQNSSLARIMNDHHPRISITLKLLIITTLIFSCSGCFNDGDELDSPDFRYRIGDTEAILNGGYESNMYKGMIYEYGVGDIEIDLKKAKEYYAQIKNKHLSAKRNFLLCYLYCVNDVTKYFERTKGKYTGVNILFAVKNILSGEKCHHYIDNKSCFLAKKLVGSFKRQELYYEVGVLLYEKAKRIRDPKEPFKFFEMPYYFIMKSYVEGNKQSLNYLSALPRAQSWVPVNKKRISNN